MIYTPQPHQQLMIAHAIDVPRCALWAGMGLGKTSATLLSLDYRHILGEDRPTLVLAPLRVARSTWPNEAKKWRNLRHIEVVPVVGTEKERTAALARDVAVHTCNYDNLKWLVDYYGADWPFGTIVADESTRLKGFRGGFVTHPKTGKVFYRGGGGQRARALGRVAHSKVTRFVELTGTPSPNGLLDLWGQAWFLDAGQRLGRTIEAYKQRYFRVTPDGWGLEPLPFAQEQVQDKLRDLCLSLRSEDYFDVELPIFRTIFVDLPPAARQLYKSMEKELYMQIEGHEVEAFNAAAKTGKCLQLANGAVYVDPMAGDDEHPRSKKWKEVHNAKLEALDSIIEESAGAPVLVAYQFRSDLARLLHAFPHGRVLDDDPQTETDWNAGKIPILFAHPKSCGHGLNLQDGGNILVFFGHDWNLEEYLQIIERIGPVRQAQAGHPRSVFVYSIVARDTVDEVVMARRESKRGVQDLLLEALRGKQ